MDKLRPSEKKWFAQANPGSPWLGQRRKPGTRADILFPWQCCCTCLKNEWNTHCPPTPSIFLPLLRKSFPVLPELPSQHSHRQLLLHSSIVSFSNFIFYLHYPGSFTFEVLYMGCHGGFPPTQAAGRECYKWVIEGLGELLRMGSDKNAHQPHQRLTPAEGYDSQLGTCPPRAHLWDGTAETFLLPHFLHGHLHTVPFCAAATQYGLCREL